MLHDSNDPVTAPVTSPITAPDTRQTVLVLGAGGFIGSKVAADLAKSSWATPILGIRDGRADKHSKLETRFVEAGSTESVGEAMRGVTAVVNCINGDARTIIASARAIRDAATSAGSTLRIVHLSTISVYGNIAGLIDESAELRGKIGAYADAKVAAETIVAQYPRSTIFRPGVVFGPHSERWGIRIAELLLSGRLGDLGAAGYGYCNLVHVNDVSRAIMSALQSPEVDGRAFNLGIKEPPTWNEFLRKYANALGAAPVGRISRARLDVESMVFAPVLHVSEMVRRSWKLSRRVPSPIPPSLVRFMGQKIRLDASRAQTELGLRWTDLDASVEETARWYLELLDGS